MGGSDAIELHGHSLNHPYDELNGSFQNHQSSCWPSQTVSISWMSIPTTCPCRREDGNKSRRAVGNKRLRGSVLVVPQFGRPVRLFISWDWC